MVKETYTVYESCKYDNPNRRKSSDSSYKSCICTLLIFFVICMLILLISTTIGSNNKSKENNVEVLSTKHSKQSERLSSMNVTTVSDIETTSKSKTKEPEIQIDPRFNNIDVTTEAFIKNENNTKTTTTTRTKIPPTTAKPNKIGNEKDSPQTEKSSRTEQTTSAFEKIPTSSKGATFVPSKSNTKMPTTESITQIWTSKSAESKTTTESETENAPVTHNIDEKETHITSVVSSTTMASEASTVTDGETETTITDESITTYVSTKASSTPMNEINSPSNEDNPETTTEYKTDQFSTSPISDVASSTENGDNGNSYIITDRTTSTPQATDAQNLDEATTTAFPSTRKNVPACKESGECKSMASRMLGQMNHSEDQCGNFYEYACGGSEEKNDANDVWNKIAVQLPRINSASPLYLKKFKTFYDSCIDFENGFNYRKRLEGVRRILTQTGKFILEKDSKNNVDVTKLFASLVLYKAMPLFDISIDLDESAEKKFYQLRMSPPNSLLHKTEYKSAFSEIRRRCRQVLSNKLPESIVNLGKIHEEFVECQKNAANYLDSVVHVLTEFGVYMDRHVVDEKEYEKHIKFIRMTIELTIIQQLEEYAPTRMSSMNKIEMSISQLNTEYPIINWHRFLEIILQKTVSDDTNVVLIYPEYFNSLLKRLDDKWRMNNGLMAIFVHDLYNNFVTPAPAEDTNLKCLQKTSELMKDVATNMYMKVLPAQKQNQMHAQINSIFKGLKDNLATSFSSSGLSKTGTELLKEKLDGINLKIFRSQNKYHTVEALNKKYKNVILGDDKFLRNLEILLKKSRTDYFSLVGRSFDHQLIFVHWASPLDKEPALIRSQKMIVTSFALLEGTSRVTPELLRHIKIALPLARAIGQFFTHIGIQDVKAHLPPEDNCKYTLLQRSQNNALSFERTRNFNKKILKFKLGEAEVDSSLDSRVKDDITLRLLTNYLEENNEAMYIPFMTPENFTEEKIFFIYLTQQFCTKLDVMDYTMQLFESETLPAPLRVNHFLGNSEKFSKVFKCAIGSDMNPGTNIPQFPYLEFPNYSYDYSEGGNCP